MMARLGFAARPYGVELALCICRESTLDALMIMLFRDEAACLEALLRCGISTAACSKTYAVVEVEMDAFENLLNELGGLARTSRER